MSDWFHKIPIVCAIVSAASGLKILAEKQLDTMHKMRDSIHLLEAIRLPEEKAGVAQVEAPKQEPVKQVPAVQKTLIMHTMTPCVWCRTDKANIIPIWKARGYTIGYVDEGQGLPGNKYPWYEITDETGTKKIHVGSLAAFR